MKLRGLKLGGLKLRGLKLRGLKRSGTGRADASHPRLVVALVLAAAFGLHVAAAATFLLWPARDVPQYVEVRAHWIPSDAFLLDRHREVIDSVRVDFAARRLEWVPLGELSPALVAAIVDGEDQRFWQHAGVDWLGALSALGDWLDGEGRGASTITMQLAGMIDARVADHGPRGSVRRKLAQVRAARGIEARWSKQEILEAYLNLLEFRGELQGIGSTVRALAGKAPSGLDVPESLVIAALLPAPAATPQRVAARACARAQARRLPVTCESIQETTTHLLARASARPHAIARLAPHLAHALLRQPGQRVSTTLDAGLQREVLGILDRQLARLASRNVRDGAALVVDNDTGDVLAYVGSGGPGSTAPAVDGVHARRQAGSTLKPFLYELALERRLLTAASLLDDSPVHLDTANGSYVPQDYDREHKGLVSVRTALASSLNIPAVRTLVLVGVEPFRERLEALGYAGITRESDYYGYALALGSAEVSLWEQAQAYRALARGGQWMPIRVLVPLEHAGERRTLSEPASFIVADILADRAARTLAFGLDNHLNTPHWSAAKTGTSKDMRDNWCIGFSERFTVAVWVGNFEGEAMHDVSGVSGAAPAWQEIMAAAHANTTPLAPAAPQGVTRTATTFSPPLEPSRREWFLDDGPRSGRDARIVALAARDAIARIASPADGMVVAIDPDIPPASQRLPFLAEGAGGSARFVLDGKALGSADKGLLWEPRAGSHRLVLEDAAGAPLDQILFTVR